MNPQDGGEVVACSWCGKAHTYRSDEHPWPERFWCSPAWHAAHPEEAAQWIPVADLTLAQRAELDAILGHSAGSA